MARTQTNRVANIIVSAITDRSFSPTNCRGPKNRILVNRLIAKMFMYSAIKMRANNPLLYSMLNPETNSDSPSAKSNGVRLVSARLVINQVIIIGNHRVAVHEIRVILVKSNIRVVIKIDNKIRAILTSYEMV